MTTPSGITFKKFKHVAALSEETLAYSADVYFNGEKIGASSNRGHGAQSSFYPETGKQALVAEANAWAKEQVLLHQDRPFRIDGKIIKASSLEDFCDWQAGYELDRKSLQAQIKRNTKAKTVFIDPDREHGLFTYGASYSEKSQEAILKGSPNAIFLNPLPIEQALDVVLEARQKKAATLEAAEYGAQPAAPEAVAKPRKPRP